MRSLLRKSGIICTLVIFFSGINAFANEDPAKLIYLTENFPPLNYIENDELKGFSVELLKLIWKELDVKPQKIKIYPWARALNILENENNIVLFTTAKTEARVEMFKWVGPITTNTRTAIIALKENRIRIRSLDEAKKYLIGIIRNDAAEQILLSSGIEKESIQPVSRFEQNIKKIKVGRIDLIAYNEYSFYNIMRVKGMDSDEFETVYRLKETIPCYAFSKNVSDSLVKKFQYALDKIMQDNEYQKLIEKYYH